MSAFYDSIDRVIARAEKLNISKDKRFVHFMDIEFAAREFDIDLKAWLKADDFNFAHDFIGIYNNIDRSVINSSHNGKEAFRCFVPRFARLH